MPPGKGGENQILGINKVGKNGKISLSSNLVGVITSTSIAKGFFNDKKADVLAGLKPKLLDEISLNNDYFIIEEPFTFIKQSVGVKKANQKAVFYLNKLINKY